MSLPHTNDKQRSPHHDMSSSGNDGATMSSYVTIARQEARNGVRGKAAKRKHEVTDNDRSVTRAQHLLIIIFHDRHNDMSLPHTNDKQRSPHHDMSSYFTVGNQDVATTVRQGTINDAAHITTCTPSTLSKRLIIIFHDRHNDMSLPHTNDKQRSPHHDILR
jgi:hypothetical protein